MTESRHSHGIAPLSRVWRFRCLESRKPRVLAFLIQRGRLSLQPGFKIMELNLFSNQRRLHFYGTLVLRHRFLFCIRDQSLGIGEFALSLFKSQSRFDASDRRSWDVACKSVSLPTSRSFALCSSSIKRSTSTWSFRLASPAQRYADRRP
jgi:hypothetical protein